MARRTAPRFDLNRTMIAELQPPPGGGRTVVYDAAVQGLCVVVSASRAKARPGEPPPRPNRSWVLYRWYEGQPRRWKIGNAEEITPDVARREAEKLRGKLVSGTDPSAERRERRKSMKAQEFFDKVYMPWARLHKRSWVNDSIYIGQHAKPLLGKRLSEITGRQVVALHMRLAGHMAPATANKVVALLRAMLSRAVKWKYLAVNPAADVHLLPTPKRTRHLRPDESKAFFSALAHTEQPWRDIFGLALWTGARKGNLLSARWADIDLERRLWIIPDDPAGGVQTKTRRTYTIPLIDQAYAILKRRRQEIDKDNPWVFPADRPPDPDGKPLPPAHAVNPYKAWAELTERAGLADLHLHDLRRTAGTWMVRTGASPKVIGDALGHSTLKAVEHYIAAVDPELVRRDLSRAADALVAAGTDKPATRTKRRTR